MNIIENIEKLRNKKLKYSNIKPVTQERCLHCGKIIYIGFKEFSKSHIFCSECYKSYINKPTTVQYRYMAYIKNRQMNLQKSIYK